MNLCKRCLFDAVGRCTMEGENRNALTTRCEMIIQMGCEEIWIGGWCGAHTAISQFTASHPRHFKPLSSQAASDRFWRQFTAASAFQITLFRNPTQGGDPAPGIFFFSLSAGTFLSVSLPPDCSHAFYLQHARRSENGRTRTHGLELLLCRARGRLQHKMQSSLCTR